jgi:hypothetical protein
MVGPPGRSSRREGPIFVYEHWSCSECGAEGHIKVRSDAPVDVTYQRALDAHADATPKCFKRPYMAEQRKPA